MAVSFDDMIKEIEYILKEEKPLGTLDHPGGCKEIILHGPKARGAGYRVRKRLKNDYEFINITDPEQTLPISDKPIVLYIDLRNFDQVPENLRELAKSRKDVKILAIDSQDKDKGISLFSFELAADYYLYGFEKDIDPEISRAVASLYANVDYAFDKDGVESAKGLVKPYFKTSVLIDYPRSRDILEGNLSSVIRKFNPEVIASRETVGVPPEDVRMFELAQPLAEKLGIEAVRLEKTNGGYSVDGNVKHKDVLLLEDVVGDGTTKIKLVNAIKRAEGFIKSCIVLLDRKEGAKERLEAEKVELYALTDIDWFNFVAAEKKIR